MKNRASWISTASYIDVEEGSLNFRCKVTFSKRVNGEECTEAITTLFFERGSKESPSVYLHGYSRNVGDKEGLEIYLKKLSKPKTEIDALVDAVAYHEEVAQSLSKLKANRSSTIIVDAAKQGQASNAVV